MYYKIIVLLVVISYIATLYIIIYLFIKINDLNGYLKQNCNIFNSQLMLYNDIKTCSGVLNTL